MSTLPMPAARLRPAEPVLPAVEPVEALAAQIAQARLLPADLKPLPRLVTWNMPLETATEQFRRLAVRLQNLRTQRELGALVISSGAPREGKSLIAANLAMTLARLRQERVLLLEGDLHRPTLLHRLRIPEQPQPGLGNWLESKVSLSECLLRHPTVPLWLLPGGQVTRPPLELLENARLGAWMRQLKQHFDWVVVDAPPLLPLADASHWINISDGVLLIIRQHLTRRAEVRQVMELLTPGSLVGVVLNDSTGPEHRYYSQYYYGRRSKD